MDDDRCKAGGDDNTNVDARSGFTLPAKVNRKTPICLTSAENQPAHRLEHAVHLSSSLRVSYGELQRQRMGDARGFADHQALSIGIWSILLAIDFQVGGRSVSTLCVR